MSDISALEGRLLIAIPGMPDPRFREAVVFLCSHGQEGALGLIVNKPAHDLSFDAIAAQMGLAAPEREIRVHLGGPVDTGRGFVLHSPDYALEGATLRIGDFGMSGSARALEEIAGARGPSRALLALGYAGWGPGQLEAEIAEGGWRVADPDDAIVFGEDDTAKWQAALELSGIDPRLLGDTPGHA